MAVSNAKVAQYRIVYRRSEIPSFYSGLAHIAVTFLVPLAFVVYCLIHLQESTWREWLTVPLTFIFANHFEYWFHRYILHVPRFGLKKLYRLHSLQHHKFYTHDQMSFDNTKDIHMVLFPLYSPFCFIALAAIMAIPILVPLFGWNVAYLFMATGLAFYFLYEICHFLSHIPKKSRLFRLGIVRAMRKHHTEHHRQKHMMRYNFNITPPLSDWLFRTLK